jgi:hypothetical protein
VATRTHAQETISEIQAIPDDPAAEPAMAESNTQKGADLVQRRLARRESGAGRSHERQPEAGDVSNAGELWI